MDLSLSTESNSNLDTMELLVLSEDDTEYNDNLNEWKEICIDEQKEILLQEDAMKKYTEKAMKETAAVNLDSDEEKKIVNNIKEEIKRQVREEMKEELSQYRVENLALMFSGRNSSGPSNVKDQNVIEDEAYLSTLDPKIRDGILQMRKLDKVLLKRMQREREVKRDRIQLQNKLRFELRNLEECSTSRSSKEIKENTSKFLALKSSAKHDEGVFSYDSPPMTPVFKTQYLDDDPQFHKTSATSSSRVSKSSLNSVDKQQRNSNNKCFRDAENRRQSNRDFIKRNIQLAGAAGEIVAMTVEEKARLENLLSDLENIREALDDGESLDNGMGSAWTHDGDSSIVPRQGCGFTPDLQSAARMQEIEVQLSALNANTKHETLTDSDSILASYLYRRLNDVSKSIIAPDELGELSLREVAEDRELRSRLESVEHNLKALQMEHRYEVTDGQLQPEQVTSLVADCLRSLSSRCTNSTMDENNCQSSYNQYDSFDESLESGRFLIPPLPASTLQKLLQEARLDGIGGPVPALRDSELDVYCNVAEEQNHEAMLAQKERDEFLLQLRTRLGETPPFESSSQSAQVVNNIYDASDDESISYTCGVSALSSARPLTRRNESASTVKSASLYSTHSTNSSRTSTIVDTEERLVLPDITLFANLSAPKSSR